MDSPAMKSHYDYIVVGCGGIGSSAVYWLSKRVGNGVLGLEQFKLGHVNGGSQDHSRIIRLQYNEAKYTRLTRDTYKAWEAVEQESGVQLVYKVGAIQFAKKSVMGATIDAYAEAMDANQIPYERWSGTELRRRFPQFTVGDETVCLWQKDGGLVDASMANAVQIQLARANGADILDNCPVIRIDRDDHGRTVVHTPKGMFSCKRVVVAAGAWINHVLGSVGVHIPVVVTQEQVTYFATPHVKEFTKAKFPVWIYNSPKHDLYGLPIHGISGSKIGIDAGGNQVTPETRNFTPDPEREKACIHFLKSIIPRSLGPILESKTCLYTMTLDRSYVIDTLESRGWPEIVFCCGAGHAFKFACLLGKILSELAIDGQTKYDVMAFTMNRPAITDPTFKPQLQMVVQNDFTSKL
ncbi:monomeric sarcosine oxidase-like [Liolophura sinensis]|uniref:monomeric sarcosine oxidase-like n=1 Tax=Liolophura sinensis TaxID=3198878 RepID=UPI0031596799